MVDIPPGLAGPIDVALATSTETIPKDRGLAFEPKWDGYRAILTRTDEATRIWSRRGNDLTDRFPDVAAAAARMLPAGTVVDGELCILHEGRLSFDQLQRRLVTSPAKARQLVADHPASYVAFDLLAIGGGVDLRTQSWSTRRGRLEQIAGSWALPLQVTPVTYDVDEAREWFEDLPAALGVEGLVMKPTASRYVGGRRSAWVKHRDTREVIVGGVLGPIERPEVVIAGRYRGEQLLMVGRTAPLTAEQSVALGAVLRPSGARHPWPDEFTSYRWGGKDSKKPLTKVSPTVVVEVAADAALQGGQWRHALRYVRLRADLRPEDVTSLGGES